MVAGANLYHIRDPIHRTIRLTTDELAIVETPVFQRLRGIKQLGFADHAFPGATHTRFAHSLGAMEMASRMFDAVFPLGGETPFDEKTRIRFRQLLRLAVLLHDIGHAPLSHATERCMPLRSKLGLDCIADQNAQATHEDFTTLLLLRSEIAEVIKDRFSNVGISAEDVANLITGVIPQSAQRLIVDGINYQPLLSQIVSGELDADRMDYMQRDSYHAGVDYGRFDQDWLLDNLSYYIVDDAAYLSLYHRAIFAFEDFLLSRYHMFVSVYYHHTSIGYDAMLSRYIDEEPDYRFPHHVDEYIAFDDVAFWSMLRQSKNPWAERIVKRDIYRRILELNADEDTVELDSIISALDAAGIQTYISRDESVLSRYYTRSENAPIYIVNKALARARRVDSYSKLYERYAQPAKLVRIYCNPSQRKEAQACLRAVMPKNEQLSLVW